MKLVILAGGKGLRISDVLNNKPKPLCKIGDIPMILHIMFYYSKFGIKDFIICTGYKGLLINKFLSSFSHFISFLISCDSNFPSCKKFVDFCDDKNFERETLPHLPVPIDMINFFIYIFLISCIFSKNSIIGLYVVI